MAIVKKSLPTLSAACKASWQTECALRVHDAAGMLMRGKYCTAQQQWLHGRIAKLPVYLAWRVRACVCQMVHGASMCVPNGAWRMACMCVPNHAWRVHASLTVETLTSK